MKSSPIFLRGWILISTYFSLLGWTLALSAHLNATGYLLGLGLGAVLLTAWLRGEFSAAEESFCWKPHLRRWHRPLPLLFALVMLLVAIGAACYAPSDYDALTYRVPQILHWLDAGRWHWIPVSDLHVNISPPGYGWLMAPCIALLHTDRLFALPNLVAFAFLPGLYFSVLRGCGVRGRVAWYWMWLVPMMACLVMQAGGMGSDLLPTVYALASIAFGLRAARRGRIEEFWYSALAISLATGVKVTVAPLAVVWLVATLPCWRLLRRKPVGSMAVAAIALLVSYLPTALTNTVKTGMWTGDPKNETRLRIDSPIHGVVGNSLMILAGAFEPPVLPVAKAVEARFHHLEDTELVRWIREGFPRFDLTAGELASEENSGFGLSLFALAIVSAIGGSAHRKLTFARGPNWGRWLGLASYFAFGVYLAKMGSEAAPRLAAPYYPFLLIPVLRGTGQESLTRRRWWRVVAILAALSMFPPIILTPSRPLWPAESTLAWLAGRAPGSALIRRARDVYAVYAQRHDFLASIKALLPASAHTIGFIPTPNDIEGALWPPYGSRRYVEVMTPSPHDPVLAQLQGSAIIASERGIVERFETTPDKYVASIHGHLLGEARVTQKVSVGPEKWFIIALDGSLH